MYIPHTRHRIGVQLPLSHPEHEFDGAEVLPQDAVLVLPEVVADDALEVWSCFGWFCACCAEAAAVEGED